MSPFQALYGRLPPTIPRYFVGQSPVDEVDRGLADRDELLLRLKQNLEAARNRMKQKQTVFWRAHQKLASKFYGPYPIERKIGAVAYQLKLPTGAAIHPVFHVSVLKKKPDALISTSSELPLFTEDGEIVLEPETIRETRWIKTGKQFVEECLVK